MNFRQVQKCFRELQSTECYRTEFPAEWRVELEDLLAGSELSRGQVERLEEMLADALSDFGITDGEVNAIGKTIDHLIGAVWQTQFSADG